MNRRQRKQRADARSAALEHLDGDPTICKGTLLTVTASAPIYKSSKSWDVIGEVSAGMKVEASGPQEMVEDYIMVPISPHGAVEWRVLACETVDAVADACESEDLVSVIVKTGKGQKKEVHVSSVACVATLKELACQATLLPPSLMQLSFNGEDLKEDKCISDYGICSGSILTIGSGAAGGA